MASIFLGLFAFGLVIAAMMLGKDVPVLDPSGVVAKQQKDLILFTTLLSAVVVVPVFLMLGVIATRYRENGGNGKYTPDEEDNHWFEILWWGIPIVIIVILGVVTWISTHQLDPSRDIDSPEKPLTVQVVALQWRWLFLYPEFGVASVNELRIPEKVPINFQLTADGPMSGFWIPALGTQTYAMPAMSAPLKLHADKVGTYRGSNTNISGAGYSDMYFQAIAMTRQDFKDWAMTEGDSEKNMHLDWSNYQELAKPKRDKKVRYYHLHNSELYSDIVNKYAKSGHGNSNMEGHQ